MYVTYVDLDATDVVHVEPSILEVSCFTSLVLSSSTDRLRPLPPIDSRQHKPSPNVRSIDNKSRWTNYISSVVGAAQGVNQAAQCVGAILIAPLIKRWPTRSVLACAILFFGLMTTILLIVDAGTGGSIRASASSPVDYGSWNPNAVSLIESPQSFCNVPNELIDFRCMDLCRYRIWHGWTHSPCHVRNFCLSVIPHPHNFP